MKLKHIGLGLQGLILAFASFGIGTLVLSPIPVAASAVSETKAIVFDNSSPIPFKKYTVGGLDLIQYGEYGMSPMEYGIKYGSGGRKHNNKLRYSHNAKIKRRKK